MGEGHIRVRRVDKSLMVPHDEIVELSLSRGRELTAGCRLLLQKSAAARRSRATSSPRGEHRCNSTISLRGTINDLSTSPVQTGSRFNVHNALVDY